MLRPSVLKKERTGGNRKKGQDNQETECSRMLMARQLIAIQRLTMKIGQEVVDCSWKGS